MKYLLIEVYNDVTRELENIKKTRLLLSERVALEKALAKLDALRKIINHCNIQGHS